MEYQWYLWIFLFFLYSFMGWIWECLYVSAKEKKWINRGFLNGPLLPIYGSGAVTVLWLTLPIRDNVGTVFIVGMLGATVLEFVVGYAMEEIFKMKYWDYSKCFANVRGYICLKSSLCWGVFSTLLVEWFHPYIEEIMFKIPTYLLLAAESVVGVCFVVDVIYSGHEAFDLRRIIVARLEANEQIKILQKRIDVLIAVTSDSLEQMVDNALDKMAEEKQAAADEIANIQNQMESYYARLEEAGTKAHKRALHILKRNPSSQLQEYAKLNIAQMKGYLEEKVSKIRK